ncbi:MAG: sensor histidine kinase [Rhizobiales bacterium]|nr:sensor histidine kinase [Hyphomicrobiales bacterium]
MQNPSPIYMVIKATIAWLLLSAGVLTANLTLAATTNPTAIKGILQAPNWQYEGHKLLLVGEWQVIWGDIVPPEKFDDLYQGDYFELPHNWNDVNHSKMDGAYGVATFRLTLNLPTHAKDLSLLVVSPNSAWNIFLDGALLANNGVVSQDLTKFKTHYIPRTLTVHDGNSELVLQVANFSNAYGGAEYAMAIWDAAELTKFHDLMSLFFALALGILFSIGLIHMEFYLADRRHQDQGPVHLWFSMLCFLLVIRVFGVIPFFHTYTPDFVYWSSLLLPYFTLYAAPAVYLLFFRAAFGQQFPEKLTLYIIWLCLIMASLTLLLPEYIYTQTKNYAITLNVFAIIYSIIFTIKAVKHKQPGAGAILTSNFIFLLTALNDSVLHIMNGNGFDMTPFGIVVLSMGYSYALLLRLQNTFHAARDTSKALEVLNVKLEEQVADRTHAFEAAAAKANNNANEKAQFIAAASHDLRQPLHALSMFNFALMRQVNTLTPPEGKLSELVDKQASAINNLANLLQDTLDVSKTDSLKRQPKPTEIDLSILLDEILAAFHIRAKAQNIELLTDNF